MKFELRFTDANMYNASLLSDDISKLLLIARTLRFYWSIYNAHNGIVLASSINSDKLGDCGEFGICR